MESYWNTSDREAFCVCQNRYYINSIGVHCVKHDGWDIFFAMNMKNKIKILVLLRYGSLI